MTSLDYVGLVHGVDAKVQSCSFCFIKNPRWLYGAYAFSVLVDCPGGGKHNIVFNQNWFACNDCAFLIDLESNRALLDRSMKVGANERIPETARAIIQEGFLKSRTGHYAKLY